MSSERLVYLGLLVAAAFWAAMSALLLLGETHEGTEAAAWFWGACFAGASLASSWCFWELVGGAA